MTKLCIVDLDGVVANVDARFAHAEEVKKAFIEQASNDLYAASEREAANVYWQAVFDPAQVPLDTLIDGVKEALEELDRQNWQLLYLTSRPESMRQATVEWLNDYSLYGWSLVDFPGFLIMKAPAFQYTKTTVWKAGMVQTLEALYGATDLLIIDDEQNNISEHLKYFSNVETRQFARSLAEAVAKLNGAWKEIDPFLPED